jgi:hypothetical protein
MENALGGFHRELATHRWEPTTETRFRLGPLTLFVEHRELLFEGGDFELSFQNILLQALTDCVSIPRDLLEAAEQIILPDALCIHRV